MNRGYNNIMENNLTVEKLLNMSVSERNALKSVSMKKDETNTDCSRCSDCSGCYDCSDCSRCSGCYDCSYCSRCSRCSGCSGCSYCSDCIGITDAKNMQYVAYGVQLTKEQWEELMSKK